MKDNPDWLDDERIKKALRILKGLQTAEQLADFGMKILEEIDIEKKKPERDQFYLSRLSDLSKECQRRFQAEHLKQLNNNGETA
ncbi:hypothetical protein [Aeromonas popoffii]|uniref:hypothetical protein n=1 Tax=Aeromonas popoffii TaxID=70856 RepID=UPI0030CF271F